MKSLLGALACAILAVMGATLAVKAGDAPPPPQGPIHVTIFYDVTPGSVNQAIAMLKQYRDGAKGEPGATRITLYQEVGAPFRLVSLEVWQDMASYQAHAKAASTTGLNDRMKAVQYGPPDARPHAIHFATPEGKSAGSGGVTIISHLDVPPMGIPALLDFMKPFSEAVAKQPGMVTYQVLRQTAGARNHFRSFEIWASEKDWEAHNLAKYSQDYRNGMAPLLGTPYDQRKYTVVN
jgi:quinol monooxygenase YgiN